MGKIWVEVCLISARGLPRSSSLWKLQWFAVGWIDPNNKYCTKIDASGNGNPVWKTKSSLLVDSSETNFKDKAFHVEVYSREPIFLREKLLGTATIILKEFLDKYLKNSEVPKPIEEMGSFQLRKKNSNKPQGFVDLSIRISEEREESSSHPDMRDQEGFMLIDRSNGINLDTEYGPQRACMSNLPPAPRQQPENHPQAASSYTHPMAFPKNYSNPPTSGLGYASAGGTSYSLGGGTSYQSPRTPPSPIYQPPRTPPPPPPPSNVGYIPTLIPRTDNIPPSYVNMPSSGPVPRPSVGPGFGMGVGAGALAAGAMIFGEDFMSGFDLRHGLQDPSLIISTDPPF